MIDPLDISQYIIYDDDSVQNLKDSELALVRVAFMSIDDAKSQADVLTNVRNRIAADIGSLDITIKGRVSKLTAKDRIINMFTEKSVRIDNYVKKTLLNLISSSLGGRYLLKERANFVTFQFLLEKFPQLRNIVPNVDALEEKYAPLQGIRDSLTNIESKFLTPTDPKDNTALTLTLAEQKNPEVAKLMAEIEKEKERAKRKVERETRGQFFTAVPDIFGEGVYSPENVAELYNKMLGVVQTSGPRSDLTFRSDDGLTQEGYAPYKPSLIANMANYDPALQEFAKKQPKSVPQVELPGKLDREAARRWLENRTAKRLATQFRDIDKWNSVTHWQDSSVRKTDFQEESKYFGPGYTSLDVGNDAKYARDLLFA